jgi:MerR family mercuric resistance operon transcriptional regulator
MTLAQKRGSAHIPAGGERAPFSIGGLARLTGVKIETIRYYERIGLLATPLRGQSGYRLYGLADVKRLNFIRRARALGFGLSEVRTLLQLAGSESRSCAEARRLGTAHLASVEAKIADLEKMRRLLRELIARCAGGALPECPLIDALFAERAPGKESAARQTRPRVGPRPRALRS